MNDQNKKFITQLSQAVEQSRTMFLSQMNDDNLDDIIKILTGISVGMVFKHPETVMKSAIDNGLSEMFCMVVHVGLSDMLCQYHALREDNPQVSEPE